MLPSGLNIFEGSAHGLILAQGELKKLNPSIDMTGKSRHTSAILLSSTWDDVRNFFYEIHVQYLGQIEEWGHRTELCLYY